MLEHAGTREIKTQRLLLRRLREDDAGAMYTNYASDSEVTRYLTWQAHKSIEVSRKYIAVLVSEYGDQDTYRWGVEFGGEIIGVIDVVDCDIKNSVCEIGYVIGKAWWGSGIMTEALKAVIHYLFTVPGFNCVCARHDVENIASRRVMEKAGMREEGVLRSRIHFSDGKYHDVMYHSLLRDEYMNDTPRMDIHNIRFGE